VQHENPKEQRNKAIARTARAARSRLSAARRYRTSKVPPQTSSERRHKQRRETSQRATRASFCESSVKTHAVIRRCKAKAANVRTVRLDLGRQEARSDLRWISKIANPATSKELCEIASVVQPHEREWIQNRSSATVAKETAATSSRHAKNGDCAIQQRMVMIRRSHFIGRSRPLFGMPTFRAQMGRSNKIQPVRQPQKSGAADGALTSTGNFSVSRSTPAKHAPHAGRIAR